MWNVHSSLILHANCCWEVGAQFCDSALCDVKRSTENSHGLVITPPARRWLHPLNLLRFCLLPRQKKALLLARS